MNFNLNDKRTARWIALALFILGIVTRLPFQSQYLYHWDSVNMAFGIHEYNVITESPQYPGYIVYIVVAQALNAVFNNPQTTMVIISMFSTGLAAAAMFYLGRDMFNGVVGLIAAAFLLSSPLIWFYGEIALPHTLDLFVVILAVWLSYKIMNGDTRWLWPTTVLLALMGGFRQQDLLFLGPLLLFAVYRVGLVKLVQAAVLGALVTLAWFIPLMAFSGGLQSYMAGSGAYSARFFNTTSLLAGAGVFGLRRNLTKLTIYTLYGWSLALIPAVIYWGLQLPKSWRAWLTNRKFWFILLWITPSLVFYAVIHMGQQGLTFVYLPAFILLGAAGLERLFRSRPAVLQASTAGIVLFGIVIMVLFPTYPLGENGPKLLTYSTLRENDQLLANKIQLIREKFKPEHTLMLAANWRFYQYYLPEYKFAKFVVGAKWEIDAGAPSGADYIGQPMTAQQLGLKPDQDWQIVVMDSDLNEYSSAPLQTVQSSNGFQLGYLTLKANQTYVTNGKTFGAGT